MAYDWEKATKTQEIIKRLKNGEKQTSIARDLGITQAYVATVKKNARLAELEDMIKSGQAVILPCKVGESVYHIRKDYSKEWFIQKEKVEEIAYDGECFYVSWCSTREFYLLNSRYHYTFTTKEAAEAKLKELRGKR